MVQKGQWIQVVVDDFLPINARTGCLLFAHSRSKKNLAVQLIEKAMAKRYGSYAALVGGNTSEALYDLTGCAVEDIKIETPGKNEAWDLIATSFSQGDLIALGHIDTTQRKDFSRIGKGLRRNHAYVVTAMSLKKSEIGVYNPMGTDDDYEGESDGKGTLKIDKTTVLKLFNRAQICSLSPANDLSHLLHFSESSWNVAEGILP
eukprot:gene30492-38118_t